MKPPSEGSARDARSEIVDAALQEIGEVEFPDLLKWLTPGNLAHAREFSPSAVRYHFGRESTRFDRAALGTALVGLLAARLREQASAATDAYVEAINRMRGGAGVDAIVEALASDLEAFTPGAGDELATAADRLYLLTVAMCDNSPELTARLRAVREDILSSYDGIYELCLQYTGRVLRPGTTIRDLTVIINAFLEGLMVVGRQHVTITPPQIAEVVLRIFTSFTLEAGAPDLDAQSEFLTALRG